MSSLNIDTMLEELGISPKKTEYVSIVTGEVVKRCAPTSLKDSYAIISNNLQKYYDSKPKPVIEDYYDDEYDDYDTEAPKKDKDLYFGTSEEACKKSVEEFLQYLEMMIGNYTPKTLYIDRVDTTITYGELSLRGERKQYGSFGISNDNVLRAIYELLRVRFAESFKEQVIMGLNGWCLTPLISDETEITISSNRLADMNWIIQEKELVHDRRRKDKGLLV